MKLPRISNPDEWVELIWTDHSDTKPCYDKVGLLFRGYTSEFTMPDGQYFYNIVSTPIHGNIGKKRYESDKKFLASLDLDLDKAK